MKKCPVCKITYDDSWGVCLQCETPLEQAGANGHAQMAGKITAPTLGSNFITKQINRTNRNLLLVNVTVIFGIAYIGVSQNFSDAGYWVLLPVGIFVLSGWNITQAIRRIKNSSIHPISKKIMKYGPFNDLVEIINKEAQKAISSISGTTFTQSWMLKPSFFGLNIVHLGEIIWTYNKATTHYTNGVKTGTTIKTMIYARDGREYEVPSNEFAPTRVIDAIKNRAPWVISGYSDELKSLWESKRSEFLDAVDQKKRESVEPKAKMRGDNWVAGDDDR